MKSSYKKWFVSVMVAGLMLIVLSTGFVLAFGSEAPGSLSNALVVKQAAQELVVHDQPVVVKQKPKVGKIFRPKPETKLVTPTPVPTFQPVQPRVTPTPISSFSQFPSCFWKVGWYYGWHPAAFEYGTDFDCGYRTPVPALWGGTVIGAYRTCWDASCYSTSGGVVIVRAYVPGYSTHATYYLHLDAVNVYAGEQVHKGQILGWTGGCIGYGNWITSPWYTAGCHIEIGMDAPFLHPISYNTNPLPAINQALNS